MNRNYIKKIILTIIFIFFLIIFLNLIKTIRDNSNKNNISLVKNIIKEKYDDVTYDEKSNYLIALLKDDDLYIYNIFDDNGNKLYDIESNKKLNIVYAQKYYYIVYSDKYYLYDDDNELINESNNMVGLNEYLIKINKYIIDYDGDKVFDNINSINSYDYNKYFCINNKYLIDKKGNLLLEDVNVVDEVLDKNRYLILEKDNKFYTFYTSIDSIIGDGFDEYKITDKVYIKNNNDIYEVYSIGFRKKIKNNMNIEFNEDLYFINGYKTIKNNDSYTLYDSSNKEIINLDKQIVINKRIKKGEINKDIYYYNIENQEYKDARKEIINHKNYYYVFDKNNNYILDDKYIVKYKGKELYCNRDTVIEKKDKKIIFNNLNNNKKYTYELDKDDSISLVYKNIVIINEKDNIKIINTMSDEMKIIKNRELVSSYIDNTNKKVIIITSKNIENKTYKGSYVAE